MSNSPNRSVIIFALLATNFLIGCVSRNDYDALQAQNQQLQQEVGRLRGAIRYTVNSDLLFPSAGWQMSEDGQNTIAKLASQLASTQHNRIVVNGYTDNATVGASLRRQGITSNMLLSQKRADEVMRFMISKGVRADLGSGPINLLPRLGSV